MRNLPNCCGMSHKLRVIIDTNVLISAALRPRSLSRTVVTEVLLHHVPLLSRETFAEVSERLLLPKFDSYASREERLHFLEMLFFASERIAVQTVVTACRDPKDNAFLALAVDGKADVIVTGDRDLLVLHPYEGIAIETPRAFLERMDAHT